MVVSVFLSIGEDLMYKFLTGLLVITSLSFAQNVDTPDITANEIYEHIKFLASDELEGRAPGTGKDLIAAQYIKREIEKPGVKFLFDNGFQHFEVTGASKIDGSSELKVNGTTFQFDKDFTPIAISATGEVDAEVVFVGYGFVINEQGVNINNYANSVKGKWVMVLRGAPSGNNSELFESHSSLRKKIITAKDNGAAGVIFVSGVEFDKNDNLISQTLGAGEPDAGLPAISITRTVADLILKSGNNTIESLEKLVNSSLTSFVSLPVSGRVFSNPKVIKTKKKTMNVVAMVEGNDPKLKDEYIVIGGHFDHLGWGGPGSGSRRPDTTAIHNGADDNASGASTALETFEKIATHRLELKRSVIFIAFGAEEMGLLGSRYFVDNPPVPLSKIKLMINLDMVGRLDKHTKVLTLGGTGTAVDFEKYYEDAFKESGIDLKKSPEGYGPSDHASFYSKDIPVLFFFTGVHEDYHTPTDDYDKINAEGAAAIGEVVYKIAMGAANAAEPPIFQLAGPKERSNDTPTYKISLGIMPDMAASDIVGVRAEQVIPGRPAEKAGMIKGDIIVEVNGKPVKDLYEYMDRLSELKKGDLVDVTVLRGEEKIVLLVQL